MHGSFGCFSLRSCTALHGHISAMMVYLRTGHGRVKTEKMEENPVFCIHPRNIVHACHKTFHAAYTLNGYVLD